MGKVRSRKLKLDQETVDAALVLAAKAGYLTLLEQLIAAGANVHRNHDEALLLAAEHGRSGTVTALLKAGADPNPWPQSVGDSALRRAALGNHLETARLIVEWQAAQQGRRSASQQNKATSQPGISPG